MSADTRHDKVKDEMLRSFIQDKTYHDPSITDLMREIALLREEIAALRTELTPLSSLIITGKEAVEQFKFLMRL
jgi:uncharacterized small protein (DUF1192 family)